MHIHTVTCPACLGFGALYFERINAAGRPVKWNDECAACKGSGEIVDLSKCGGCGAVIVPDGDEGVLIGGVHGRDVGICGSCNRGEVKAAKAA